MQQGIADWPAGRFLAEFLRTNRHLARGKTCIELGAGLFYRPARVAREAGARKVIIQDLPGVIHRKIVDGQIAVVEGDWNELTAEEVLIPCYGEILDPLVLAADCIYSTERGSTLEAFLRMLRVLRPRSVLLCHHHRDPKETIWWPIRKDLGMEARVVASQDPLAIYLLTIPTTHPQQ